MRTTLNIDYEALMYAKERASVTGKPVGAIVSEVLLDAARPKTVNIRSASSGFPVISSTNEGEPITSQQVQAALNDEELEKYRGAF